MAMEEGQGRQRPRDGPGLGLWGPLPAFGWQGWEEQVRSDSNSGATCKARRVNKEVECFCVVWILIKE